MVEARKGPAEATESEPSESEIEEQLSAHAAEALNHFTRTHHINASTEIARNRLKNALYLIDQRRRRKTYPLAASDVFHEAMQGFGVAQTSELPVPPDRNLKEMTKILLQSQTLLKRAVILPKVPPIPTATMWTALAKNYEVEDEPQLKFLPYFGDDDEEDVVSEFYQIKQQRTSVCEVEYTKEMCEAVLKSLQSTWELTPSDLKRVADVIEVEEEVLVEVHKNLRLAQRAAKKKRRTECNSATPTYVEARNKEDISQAEEASISMDEYFEMYEQSADSYRTLFCRRCFVYDCDYHGCVEQPKLTCLEVAELCAYYDINDRSLVKEVRPQPKSRRSRKKKNARMSVAHLQNSQNGVVNSVQIKIEPCSHDGPCEQGVCSCVDDGIFCSKHCHCVHDECKIFFPGCQCQRGRCRTKACPCFCSGRECDIDLCKVCCTDEIAAREKEEPYDDKSDTAKMDEKYQTSCQNRSIALGKQKHVRMGRSKLSAAGWGLFVDEFVAKDEFIIEYIGEMVSQEEADRRGAVYDKVDRRYGSHD
uniref:CXC domain-containing protein n=1 Tax=Phytophthora ramorum TaxID=164328 RepID=H3GD39_PHYRM